MIRPPDPPFLAEQRLGLAPGSFPFESRFMEVAGARIHGNPTWSFVFRHLILQLRDRFRCIAPDLPGFGLSTALRGTVASDDVGALR